MFTHTNLQACKTHIQTYEHANQQPYKHTHHTKNTKNKRAWEHTHIQQCKHSTKHKDIRTSTHHTTHTIPIPEYEHTSMQTNTPTEQTSKYTYTRTYIQQVKHARKQKIQSYNAILQKCNNTNMQ